MSTPDPLQQYIRYFMQLPFEEARQEIARIPNPDTQTLAESILFSLQHGVKRGYFEGWTFHYNPFAEMDLKNLMPRISPDILNATHELTHLANTWLDFGLWRIPEDYYKSALSLAFISNNVFAALLLGANLSLCYLLGQDIHNAQRVIDQAMPTAVQIKNWTTVHRMGTVKRLCLAKNEQWELITAMTRSLKEINPTTAPLEPTVLKMGINAYQFMNAKERLQSWQLEWVNLEHRKE